MRRILAAVSALFGLVTVVGLVLMWPSGSVVSGLLRDVLGTPETYDARVVESSSHPCEGTLPEDEVVCFTLAFVLLGGPNEDQRAKIEVSPDSPLAGVEVGTTIVVARNPDAPRDIRYSFVDVQRGPVLLALSLLFAIAVVLLGRLRGAAALVGLAGTLFLLLEFVLPAILAGRSPMIVAAIGASAMAYLSLYLAHGFGAMTSIALVGTLSSLAFTVVLGSVFVDLANFLSAGSEEGFLISIGASSVDLSGLVLAGVIIGALGAIDDITVTQASAVSELAAANPSTPRTGLFRAGMRIGRDHVSSTVNTLFLAYAGASLPLLLLFVLSDQSPFFVANREIVAVEIVRTLVGSIGLVASVPITTWLSAYCHTSTPPRHGHRAVAEDQRREQGREEAEARPPPAGPQDFWIPERRFDVFRRHRKGS